MSDVLDEFDALAAEEETNASSLTHQFGQGVERGLTMRYAGESVPSEAPLSAKVAGYGGEIIGSIPPGMLLSWMAAPLAAGVKGLPLLKTMVQEGIAGAAFGAIQKPDEGDSRLQSAKEFGAIGFAAPPVIKGAFGALKGLGRATGILSKAAPSVAEEASPAVLQMFDDLAQQEAEVATKQTAGANAGTLVGDVQSPVNEAQIARGYFDYNKTVKGIEAGATAGRPPTLPANRSGIPAAPHGVPEEIITGRGERIYFDELGQPIPEHMTPQMMQLLPPKTSQAKALQVLKKVPSSMDEDFDTLPVPVQRFVQEQIEGPLPRVNTMIKNGFSLQDALTHATEETIDQDFINLTRRGSEDESVQMLRLLEDHRTEFRQLEDFSRVTKTGGKLPPEGSYSLMSGHSAAEGKALIEESVKRSRLAMGSIEELLAKLDPQYPITDLAEKTGLPIEEAEDMFNQLAERVRRTQKAAGVRVGKSGFGSRTAETTQTAAEVKGASPGVIQDLRSGLKTRMSPAELNAALRHSDVSAQAFIGKGYMEPDGALTPQGEEMLSFLNKEWRTPYGEKVSARGPTKTGFDVNSSTGREALAAIRSGGKSKSPLAFESLQGLLPGSPSFDEAANRGWIRELPGGFQYTEKGAAAANNSKVLKEINEVGNVTYSKTPEGDFRGGRGGRSFEGKTEEEVGQLLAEYEARKADLIERKKAALQWTGCPPGTHEES